MVEAARDLARDLDVRHLILAHRHVLSPVEQDVGRLQQRIAEKSVGGEILVRELRLLILVGGNALQPAEGVIMDSSRCSSACSGTCDWMKSVATPGFNPAASQSMAIVHTYSSSFEVSS